jgi:ATP-dependent protease ClpP protease subunit
MAADTFRIKLPIQSLVNQMLDQPPAKDVWLTAEEAVELGVADKIKSCY